MGSVADFSKYDKWFYLEERKKEINEVTINL
jgi:hypothetical protein